MEVERHKEDRLTPLVCLAKLVDLAEELEHPNDRFRVFLIEERYHDIYIGRETRYLDS